MTATYNPEIIDRLLVEAREQYRLVEIQGYGLQAGTVYAMADQLEAARREVERLTNRERIRTVVDNAVIDVASVGPPLRSTNLRMMSAAIADRVADALVPSPGKIEYVDEESDYEKRNRELHRLGRLAGKP